MLPFLNLTVTVWSGSYYPVLYFLMAWEETDLLIVPSVVMLPLVDVWLHALNTGTNHLLQLTNKNRLWLFVY